jgi:hypothetical protein
MRLWAEALDIAHATRMKIDSDEPPCRGVTAVGVSRPKRFSRRFRTVPKMRRDARFVKRRETAGHRFPASLVWILPFGGLSGNRGAEI